MQRYAPSSFIFTGTNHITRQVYGDAYAKIYTDITIDFSVGKFTGAGTGFNLHVQRAGPDR